MYYNRNYKKKKKKKKKINNNILLLIININTFPLISVLTIIITNNDIFIYLYYKNDYINKYITIYFGLLY